MKTNYLRRLKDWWSRKEIQASIDLDKELKKQERVNKERENAKFGIFSELYHKMFEEEFKEEHDYTSDTRYFYGKFKNDNVHILYKMYSDFYFDILMKKHYPNIKVGRGVSDRIVFHGGCLECNSQNIHGVDRCKGCTYFKFDHDLPNLKIKGTPHPGSVISSQEEFNNIIRKNKNKK